MKDLIGAHGPRSWRPHEHIEPRPMQAVYEDERGIRFVSCGDQLHIECRPEDVTTANEFRDLYFRYLIAKRDYPWCQHAPPSLKRVYFFDRAAVARECEREFYR